MLDKEYWLSDSYQCILNGKDGNKEDIYIEFQISFIGNMTGI